MEQSASQATAKLSSIKNYTIFKFGKYRHKEPPVNSLFASSLLIFPIAASRILDIGSDYDCECLPCPRKNQKQICFGELIVISLNSAPLLLLKDIRK